MCILTQNVFDNLEFLDTVGMLQKIKIAVGSRKKGFYLSEDNPLRGGRGGKELFTNEKKNLKK